MNSRTVRVFFSSTFRDFAEERDLLVRRVFPSLRARLKDRFVELIDVDLRWGITAEQAERGEVLPICLAEIDRSRPYFVGMLGERYGWVPPVDAYPVSLVERQPWLEQHRGGKSVTELEILHGVLNNPAMAGRAFFYFRSADYAHKKGGEYVSISSEDTLRQSDLKNRIRKSGFPVVEDYPAPEAFAERLEADLWEILDKAYPLDEVPDPFERISRQHAAYAAPRRRLYLGGERYISWLNKTLDSGSQRILITGVSGGGKSALIANWLDCYRKSKPNIFVFEHYTGASADAADSVALVRRLIETIKRRTNDQEELPSDPQKLLDSLPLWLANASAFATKEGSIWVFVLDALNGIFERRDLRWFPEFLPERVHFVASCLPGDVHDALVNKGQWSCLTVDPLNTTEAQILLTSYLGRYNKTLPTELTVKIVSHPLATNPLFIRTLAEELRLFGVHEQLAERLDVYLTSKTVDDLFELVLQRVENDCGAEPVRLTMEAIWASRAGLTEQEILGVADLVPATWAPIRFALDEALLESNGRLTFAHDYLRIAVSDRYFSGNNELAEETQSTEALHLRRQAHIRLAQWFEAQPIDARVAEEIPFQWKQAKDWEKLKACLTNKEIFKELYDNRTNQEILSYWLDLEKEAGADIEQDYEAVWASWDLDEHAKETGDLASSLQTFLCFAGRYKIFTERLARLSLALREKFLGPEHPNTAHSLNNLADLLSDKGDYNSAETLYRRSLTIREKILGTKHPDTAGSLNNLAILLRNKGDYDDAEPLYHRSLAICEKILGSEHSNTAGTLNNLAHLLSDKGDYDGAEPLYRRSLAICEKILGPEHPDTAGSLSGLAILLDEKGDYDSAEPLFRRSLKIYEKVLGPEHPDTALGLNNLAILLRNKGDYDGAEPLYRRSLAIREKILGPEHPDTAQSLNNLAILLSDKGDYDGAEPLYRRSLTICEKILGPEHPDTAGSLNSLAILLSKKGDYDGAEPLYRRALKIYEKVLGPEHPDTAVSLVNLANLLSEKGDYDGAEPLYRRSLAILEKILGPEHPDTALGLNNLALLLSKKGDNDGAEPLYRRSLAIREKILGPEHPDTAGSLNNLALLLSKKGDYEAAEPLYLRAQRIYEKTLGPDHPEVARALANLASLFWYKGEYDKVETLYRQSMDIQEKVLGPEHPDTALGLNNLALLLSKKGDYNGAEPLYRRSLKIREKVLGLEHPDTSNTMYQLGNVLLALGRYNEADPIFRRELAIIEARDGSSSSAVAQSLFNLGNILADNNHWDEAEPMLRREIEIVAINEGLETASLEASYRNLGKRLFGLGHLDAAQVELQNAIKIAEKLNIAAPFVELAELRVFQQRLPEAIDLFVKSLSIAQDNSEADSDLINRVELRLKEIRENR